MRFKAKIWRTGDSAVITVPSDFVKHRALKEGLEYDIEVKEVTP